MVTERRFCRPIRVLATRVMLRSKFQIVGNRRSGVHSLTRVLQVTFAGLPAALAPDIQSVSHPHRPRFSSL